MGNHKSSKINECEIPIEEVIYDEFLDTSDMDKQLFQTSLLGWIELIENENLHKALKSLKIEDQIFKLKSVKHSESWLKATIFHIKISENDLIAFSKN